MKRYKEFINEDITKFMTPKPMEGMVEALKKLTRTEQIIKIITYQFPFELLPEGELIIPHNLFISDKNIFKLPDNLTIKGDLDCEHNKLTELPKNLNVKGAINVKDNMIKNLPDNLTIGGYLWCDYNKLTELPKKLNVGGGFTCEHNYLTTLPNDMVIGTYFYCRYNETKLEKPDNISTEHFYN